MAFSRMAFLTLLLLIVLFAWTLWFLFSGALPIQESKPSPEQKELHSHQKRFQTERTMLLHQEDRRKIGHLTSTHSTLQYRQKEDRASLLEEMEEVNLLFQEELLQDEQLVVRLQAKKAQYDYDLELFTAEQVSIARYKLKGDKLPESLNETPYFQGNAEKARIYFSDEKPALFAYGLKAEFLQ